jgi:Rne/Rng family ribonuclease
MNKELFVSATPHETKVGINEDDQLAEIYLERENEYTLAGSIYKGRVTRVLPGMQSAFVDIGLERDAFLYVSDFMDLEQQDEDLDEVIPANRPVAEGRPPRNGELAVHRSEGQSSSAGEIESAAEEGAETEAVSAEGSSSSDASRDSGNRGRRRRRGRRPERGERPDRPERTDRPERSERPERSSRERSGSETRFQRPQVQPAPPAPRTGRDYDYGPPPGYQPMILPGESISKYQRQAPASPVGAVPERQAVPMPAFPEDEPLFAVSQSEPIREPHGRVIPAEVDEEAHSPFTKAAASEAAEINYTTQGGEEAHAASVQELAHEADFRAALHEPAGHLAEEEIEEEETDLDSYVDEMEEDAGFDEMEEEETQAAGDSSQVEEAHEAIVATAAIEGAEAEGAQHPEGSVEPAEAVEEQEEREAAELELEEAQEEAEALLEAEAVGAGTVDASAEVRSPVSEARLQRAQRPAPEFDRRRGRRGGRRVHRRENHVVPQISDLLKEGQEILVQIAKEPIGKKGARITSHIALPGRFLVFMPTVNHTGVSRKISSDEERQRLKRIIISERENGGGGFIVRTAAQGASDEELRADIRFLKNLWSEIKTRSDESKPPALIYHDLNVVERVLRDQVTSDFSVIWVDNEQEYERILRFANRFQPTLVKRVKLYTKETPLFEQFGLSEEINKALKSKVWLKSGGYIVINQTEALVAIDVNTGKYVGKTARLEDTIVKTNVDAIKEIVRQIRLRDLGGIIVIDFIDMDERRNRQKVMQALEEALRHDRAPSKVLQFNDFGLVAITRKRVKQSLERTIGSPCPYCQATGFVKSVSTICNEVYVEMRKLVKQLDHTDVMLRVNPEVGKALKANNAHLLNEMEELTKKTIIVKSDPALHQEQFDIN